MKKIFSVAVLLLALGACSKEAEFVGKSYQLQQAQNGVAVTLGFAKDEPRYYGSVVNRYFGTYEVDGNNLKFNVGGTTMMMGSPEEMEAERNFLGILPKVNRFKMVDGNLVLITDNNQELGFKEIPATDN